MQPKPHAKTTGFVLNFLEDRAMSFAVKNTNLTDITFNPTLFPAGPQDLYVPGDKFEKSDLVVESVVSEDFSQWLYIYKWMLRLKNRKALTAYETKTVELLVVGSENEPKVKFIFRDSFPIMLDGLNFAYDDEKATTISCNMSFRYNDFEVVDAQGNVIRNDYIEDI